MRTGCGSASRDPILRCALTLLAIFALTASGRAAEQPIDEFGEELSGYRDHRSTGEAKFVSGDASLRLTPIPEDRSLVLELDITDAVRFGGENTLAVRANRNSLARRVSGYSNHVGPDDTS
jgi:hypothetical protein